MKRPFRLGLLVCGTAVSFAFGCTAILGDFDVASTTALDSGSNEAAANDAQAVDGGDEAGSSNHLANAKGLALGARHSCALLNNGDVVCWGDNGQGQLAQPSSIPRSDHPIKIEGLPKDVAALSSNGNHTCALTKSNNLFCWGANECGQLGANDKAPTPSPARQVVPSSQGQTNAWAGVATGLDHTCAFDTGGATYCWGCNTRNEAGSIGAGPVLKPTAAGVEKNSASAIAAAPGRTCNIGIGGVRCWGTEAKGELGNGPGDDDTSSTAVVIPYGTSPKGLTTGIFHTCVITPNDAIQCWGDNAFGERGDIDGGTASAPVDEIPLVKAKAIAAGENYTCFINADGILNCFGTNKNGELGRGNQVDNAPHPKPDNVSRPNGNGNIPFRAIALGAGRNHACAINEQNNEVLCWGASADGQLGDGTVGGQPKSTPVFVLPPR